MSSKIKVYYDLMSQPSRAVYMLLNLSKIPYEDCPVPLRKGVSRTPDFAKNVNRFKTVPCIEDNGFRLSESVAVLRYILNKFPEAESRWYPKDPQKRARIDEYLEWQHTNTRIGCAMYFQYTWLLPMIMGTQFSEKEIDEVKKRMEQSLNTIEKVWLADNRKYLTGDEITVADLWGVCEIEQTRIPGYDPDTGRPKMREWMKRVRDDTNPVYDEAHKFVTILKNRSKL